MSDPIDITSFTETAAILGRMLEDRSKILAAGPTPELSTIGEYVDALSRLTAIVKSLVQLSTEPASSNRQSSIVNRKSFHPSPFTLSTSHPSLSPASSLHQIHQTREVPLIPALPADRIAPELDAIAAKLETLGAPQISESVVSEQALDKNNFPAPANSVPVVSPGPVNRLKFPKKRKRR